MLPPVYWDDIRPLKDGAMETTRTVLRSPEALGAALARARYEHGLTQDDLAEALGVSRRYIYALESGQPPLFARRLFEVLGELGAHLELVAPAGDETSVRPDDVHDNRHDDDAGGVAR